jgi:hypothetical protein
VNKKTGNLAIKAWCVRELNSLNKEIKVVEQIPEGENEKIRYI